MKQKPSRESVRALVAALSGGTKSLIPARTSFAVTAILCQVNEGIEPHVTANLHYGNFDLHKMWVDFVPYNGEFAVRRPLSPETAEHIKKLMHALPTGPEGCINTYRPKLRNGRLKTAQPCYAQLVRKEVKIAGYNPEEFSPRRLSWIWIDEHPDVREEERRARILAQFVLRWASPFQQEALLRRIYDNLQVLRPSWAYPQWHKDAPQTAPDIQSDSINSESAEKNLENTTTPPPEDLAA